MNAQLDALREQMSVCGSCDLCKTRTKVVFGNGSHEPLILIVGEAPGEDEDLTGVPFIGKAGQKLDSILTYVGVSRQDIYITNSVLCRPPNNRTPRKEEMDACKWRLDLQIKLLRPKLIILLGRTALEQFRGEPIKGALNQFFFDKVSNKDGWLNYTVDGHESKVLVTYHPSYHLRSPEKAYRETLPHWQKIKKWVESNRRTSSVG
jgi:DNA polymerase